jgi:hypothetical protein
MMIGRPTNEPNLAGTQGKPAGTSALRAGCIPLSEDVATRNPKGHEMSGLHGTSYRRLGNPNEARGGGGGRGGRKHGA